MAKQQVYVEDNDLYELRQTAHEVIDALYDYLMLVRQLWPLSETAPLHEVKYMTAVQALEWSKQYNARIHLTLDISEFFDFYKIPELEELQEDTEEHPSRSDEVGGESENLNDPRLLLMIIVMKMFKSVDRLTVANEEFQPHLDELHEELAAVHDGLVDICRCEARSFSKALEILVDYVLKMTFEIIDASTPDDERDEGVGPDERHGFTPSNWKPVCDAIIARFPEIDLADVVHEWIEAETDCVLENRKEHGPFYPNESEGRGVPGRTPKWEEAVRNYFEWLKRKFPKETSGKYQDFLDDHPNKFQGLTASKLRATVNRAQKRTK